MEQTVPSWKGKLSRDHQYATTSAPIAKRPDTGEISTAIAEESEKFSPSNNERYQLGGCPKPDRPEQNQLGRPGS